MSYCSGIHNETGSGQYEYRSGDRNSRQRSINYAELVVSGSRMPLGTLSILILRQLVQGQQFLTRAFQSHLYGTVGQVILLR